ncbi:MAG: 2-oxoglutarate ferredoxin oxidoreductase subunit alpha, partial [Acidobacteria bacterium]|nr:2-oxoglutarate ferredoxin oxidoreductase subunit alpha [Acidobacteriota bacterium]
DTALEACRLALKYMVPVMLLSDGYIASGSEPWRLPKVEDLPDLQPRIQRDPEGFAPYRRDEATLARPWALPGTPGLEHRVGGLEKDDGSGNVSYDPENHAKMTRLRAEKVARIAQDIPPVAVNGNARGKLLVLGWGSTEGAIMGAVLAARRKGLTVSSAHLRHLNPLPADLGEVLESFEHVLLPELNSGQLAMVLQAKYLKRIDSHPKVDGRPFSRDEILSRIEQILEA